MAERTSLKQIRDAGKRKKAGTDIGVIGALADPQFREDVLRGLGETSARGVAGVLGAPVDLTTMALRPFGYSVPAEQVVGGSDYIGRQMERAGLISGERRPIAEMLGGIVSPDPADAAKLGAMFIGPLAKTWDAAAAQKAVDMEAAGIDPRKIWEETGTWRGPDKMLRQEISDETAIYRPGAASEKSRAINQENFTVADDAHKLRSLMDANNVGVADAKLLFQKQFERPPHDQSGSLAKHSNIEDLSETLKEANDAYAKSFETWWAPQEKLLEHPSLYSAYPELSNTTVRVFPEKENPGLGGFYSPEFDEINLSSGEVYGRESGKSVNLHELQHAIQNYEDFALGGSSKMFQQGPMFSETARDLSADLSKHLTGGISAKPQEIIDSVKFGDPSELNSISKRYGFKNVDDALTFLKQEDFKRTPYGQYRRLAGEAEARATQARMNMTPEQRRATFPEESYDIPLRDIINLK
jgi:hypothetical protein